MKKLIFLRRTHVNIPYDEKELNKLSYSIENFEFLEFLKSKNFLVDESKLSSLQVSNNENNLYVKIKDMSNDELLTSLNKEILTYRVINRIIWYKDTSFIKQVFQKFPNAINGTFDIEGNITNGSSSTLPLSMATKTNDENKFKTLLDLGANLLHPDFKNLGNSQMQEIIDFAKIKYKNQVINDYDNVVQNNEGSINQNEERGQLKYSSIYYKCEEFKGLNIEAAKCLGQKFGTSISNLDYIFATGDRRLKKYPKEEIVSFNLIYKIDNMGKLSIRKLDIISNSQSKYENVVKDKIEQYFNRLNSSEQKRFTPAIDTNGNYISQDFKQKIQVIIKLTY